MIRIRQFNEKVSKAEKQEIFNDPDIRVGVEFEIESTATVVSREQYRRSTYDVRIGVEEVEEKGSILTDLEKIIGKEIYIGNKVDDWHIEEDDSLSSSGAFELITPKGGLPLKEMFPIIKSIFEYIESSEYLYTSDSTGLHINMSIKGVDLKEEMDPLKLALFLEEGKVFRFFESRENNCFTLSVLQELRKSNPDIANKSKQVEYKTIMSDMSDGIIPKTKDYGINLSKIESGLNYVEFRYMGGKNHHTEYDIIRRQILDYGYFLKLSTNKEYKWKEYVLKINRLISTIQLNVEFEEVRKRLLQVQDSYLHNIVIPNYRIISKKYIKLFEKFDIASLLRNYKVDFTLENDLFKPFVYWIQKLERKVEQDFIKIEDIGINVNKQIDALEDEGIDKYWTKTFTRRFRKTFSTTLEDLPIKDDTILSIEQAVG